MSWQANPLGTQVGQALSPANYAGLALSTERSKPRARHAQALGPDIPMHTQSQDRLRHGSSEVPGRAALDDCARRERVEVYQAFRLWIDWEARGAQPVIQDKLDERTPFHSRGKAFAWS
jgi:hypothetical protein